MEAQHLRWDGVKQKTNTALVFLHALSMRQRFGMASKEKKGTKDSNPLSQGGEAFPHASMAQEWKITAYIKEGACMLQTQLVGIRFVFTVGDIHLKFICLKRTKTIIDKHPLVAPFCCPCLPGPARAVQLNAQIPSATGLPEANVLGLSGACSQTNFGMLFS